MAPAGVPGAPPTVIFLCRGPLTRSNMRRVKAALAARTPGSVCFPPCPWRIHGESSPREFDHRQFNFYRDAPRGTQFLGPDRIRGFRPGPVRCADLLRLGLHHAITRSRAVRLRAQSCVCAVFILRHRPGCRRAAWWGVVVEQRYGAVLCKSGPSGPRSRPPHPSAFRPGGATGAEARRRLSETRRLKRRSSATRPGFRAETHPGIRRSASQVRIRGYGGRRAISGSLSALSSREFRCPRSVFRNSGFAARSDFPRPRPCYNPRLRG